MKHDPALNPSALRGRVAAHRAMAVAALRSDSSLSNRLRRYNHHQTIARDLEATAERLLDMNTWRTLRAEFDSLADRRRAPLAGSTAANTVGG